MQFQSRFHKTRLICVQKSKQVNVWLTPHHISFFCFWYVPDHSHMWYYTLTILPIPSTVQGCQLQYKTLCNSNFSVCIHSLLYVEQCKTKANFNSIFMFLYAISQMTWGFLKLIFGVNFNWRVCHANSHMCSEATFALLN